ncbi:MAG: lipopolysaccharide biosynthesis protein [Geobacteraceae bacterium]|nr:lipopolysaccharide biosynthesis protein [Geobacteraceae bacterium]
MKRLTSDQIFESTHLSHDLIGKSVRGGMTTIGSQATQFVLGMASTMVLARLLTPADFGLIGMVTVVVNFAAMFKDAGLSMATVQKEKISSGQISTLFWINIFISLILGICVLIGAPLVSWFYGKPELTTVTAALSASFFLSGMSIQHAALLRRHMRFGTLAFIQIVSQVITLAVTILLAYKGYRYWALVGGTLTTALTRALLTFYFCPWIPGRAQKRTGVRDMLKFGGHLTGFEFINYFSRNMDNILIGKFIGAEALGLYAKAYQVVYLPLTTIRNPINSVAFPVLSKLQNSPERFQRYYGKIVFTLAFCSMPTMAFCIMFPEELIRLIFGEQWLGMKVVFRLLAIAGFTQAVTGTRGMLLLACGRSELYLKLGAVGALLAVTGFCIGLYWGITGVASSFIVVSFVPQYPMFKAAFRVTPCTFHNLVENCVYAFIISWISVLLVWGLTFWFPYSGPVAILCTALLMFAVYISLFLGFPSSRNQLMETIEVIRANRKVS